MRWTPYDLLVTIVTVAIVLAMIAVVATEGQSPSLVCDEPQVIAVTETATGVVVRCGPVEGEP